MVAYPFSQPPTDHRVRLDGEREVFAMCAIDALGVPFMLGVAAEIVSCDPVTGDEVWVRVEPGEGQWWEPEQALVLAGSVPGPGPSSGTCCRFVNFFSSRDSAERYLADRPSLAGGILTIPDAAAAGRIVFGELPAVLRELAADVGARWILGSAVFKRWRIGPDMTGGVLVLDEYGRPSGGQSR